jgi:hypothetical protein
MAERQRMRIIMSPVKIVQDVDGRWSVEDPDEADNAIEGYGTLIAGLNTEMEAAAWADGYERGSRRRECAAWVESLTDNTEPVTGPAWLRGVIKTGNDIPR